MPTTVYIGLGSNLGDRQGHIRDALAALARMPGMESVRASDVTASPALGNPNDPDYLNAVAEVRTTLTASDVLAGLQRIEWALGRVRQGKWTPRTIDLDLLLFGEQVIHSPDLTIPHPQMHLRTFVLRGLCQLNPDAVHPLWNERVAVLNERLGGGNFALDPAIPQLVSVCGVIGVGKTTLATKLSEALACPLLLEPYDANPFMPAVYAGNQELALDSQLYFLTERVRQLDRRRLTTGRPSISDYLFEQELIYAKRLPSPTQRLLYERIHQPLSTDVVPPVLVLYLQDSAANCLQRIHRRNRPYEQRIAVEFLKGLSQDYEELFAAWNTCPVIRLSTPQLDYARPDTIPHWVEQVRAYVVH